MRIRGLIVLMMVFTMSACSGGGGGEPGPGGRAASVVGNITNAPIARGAFATAYADDAPGRIAEVSAGQPIEVSTVITNQTGAEIEAVSFTIGIEDKTFLTQETWKCNECFGAYCNTVWRIAGGTIGNEEKVPDIPPCEGHATSGYCVTVFPEGIDCGASQHRIEYEPPGDGYWHAQGMITSIAAYTSTETRAAYGNTGIDVRPDHRAYWEIRDKQGTVLDRKEYLFDVKQ